MGPAATMAERRPTGWWKKLAALGLVHVRDRGLVRHAGGVVIPKKLHIAAQRNRRQLPAGSIAVVAADDLGAETHRKSQHLHPAPARHQEMAKLVEEHHHAQSEQNGIIQPVQPPPQSPKLLKTSISDPSPVRPHYGTAPSPNA